MTLDNIKGGRIFKGGLEADPNTIIDKESPTSTDGVKYVAWLCDLLGRCMVLEHTRERCKRGWGPNELEVAKETFSMDFIYA